MIAKITLCLTAVFSAALAAFACLTGHSARAEIGTEHRGEIIVEASWYPQSAAYAGQKTDLSILKRVLKLVIYGDLLKRDPTPHQRRNGGDGRIDFREAHVTARLATPISLSAAPSCSGARWKAITRSMWSMPRISAVA